jgi:hypothetical protein
VQICGTELRQLRDSLTDLAPGNKIGMIPAMIIRPLKSLPAIAVVVSVVLTAALAGHSRAQTSASLLLKPWPTEQFVEAQADATFMERGVTDDGFDMRLNMYETYGRVRVIPGQLISPRIGYDFFAMDIDSEHPFIPNRLYDQSLAVGVAIWEYRGWVAGMTVGAGYAGDRPFGDGNAWYGRGTMAIGRQLDPEKDSAIAFVLDYDGNRTVFPDIPLPGFAYGFRIEPKILLVVGIPVNSIRWEPNDDFYLEFTYTITDRFDAVANYRFAPHWSVFGRFDTRREAFHLEELGSRRLLWEQRRLEAGLRFSPREQFDLTVSAGYAFDGRFETGWDARDTDTVAELSDEPYIRVGLETRF